MRYDPNDYVIDSRRLGAGFGLAGAVMLALFAISCPAAPQGPNLPVEAYNSNQQAMVRSACPTEQASNATQRSVPGNLRT